MENNTPLLLNKADEIKEDLTTLTYTIDKNITQIADLINELDILRSSKNFNISRIQEQLKNSFNGPLKVLDLRVKEIIKDIEKDLIQPHIKAVRTNVENNISDIETSLINELENRLNILKQELSRIYKATFDNALTNLKTFNSNLENSKNLSELKDLSEQSLQAQKKLIENQKNINKDFEKQLKFFRFKQSFLSILLWLIVGLGLGLVGSKFVLIDLFNSYQAEKTATTIKIQEELNTQQQNTINTLRKEQAELNKYGISLQTHQKTNYLKVDTDKITKYFENNGFLWIELK